MDLLVKTNALLAQNERNLALYLKNREESVSYDFYEDIKPFVDIAKEKGDLFLQEAIPWVRSCAPPYLNEAQLNQATENIQWTAVNAFSATNAYKHFYDRYNSSKYTLDRVVFWTAETQGEKE